MSRRLMRPPLVRETSAWTFGQVLRLIFLCMAHLLQYYNILGHPWRHEFVDGQRERLFVCLSRIAQNTMMRHRLTRPERNAQMDS